MSTSLWSLWTILALQGPVDVSAPSPAAADASADASADGAVVAGPADVAIDVVAEAEARLDRGAVTEAVGLLLRHVRQDGLDDATRLRAGPLLARAADALAARDERKAAAVAADAAFSLAPTVVARPALAGHVVAFARVLASYDEAGARALAERALVIDGDNAEARILAAELAGMDTWVSGHLTLGAGVGLWAVSATAFVVGLERERLARSTIHSRAEVDQLLLERTFAAGVAWPAAVGAAVCTGLGLALIFAHDPGPEAVWPHPFPALPTTTETP